MPESRADDPETVEDGIFGQLTGKVFLDEGNMILEGNLGYLTGIQDSDAVFFSDPVEVES